MRLRLVEIQLEDSQVWKIKAEKLGGNKKDFDGILHPQKLSYIFEIMKTELINRYYDDLLRNYFNNKKTQEFVARKYYWETFSCNVEVYIRGYDICLVYNVIKYKFYENL